jgi:hypothetical protein
MMTRTACPAEVASLLLEILYRSIVQIGCNAQDAEYCFLEADHIHNLPELVRNYAPRRLLWYWDVERPLYLSRYPEAMQSWVAPLWDKLHPHVEAARRLVRD